MMVLMGLIMVAAFSIALIYRDVPHMQEFSLLSFGVMIIFMAIIALMITRIEHPHKR
jgi:FtsH-binding integral membrane protein